MGNFYKHQCIWRDQCGCSEVGCEYYTPYEDDSIAETRRYSRDRREQGERYAFTYIFEETERSNFYNI